jgi:hypothetical protein
MTSGAVLFLLSSDAIYTHGAMTGVKMLSMIALLSLSGHDFERFIDDSRGSLQHGRGFETSPSELNIAMYQSLLIPGHCHPLGHLLISANVLL